MGIKAERDERVRWQAGSRARENETEKREQPGSTAARVRGKQAERALEARTKTQGAGHGAWGAAHRGELGTARDDGTRATQPRRNKDDGKELEQESTHDEACGECCKYQREMEQKKLRAMGDSREGAEREAAARRAREDELRVRPWQGSSAGRAGIGPRARRAGGQAPAMGGSRRELCWAPGRRSSRNQGWEKLGELRVGAHSAERERAEERARREVTRALGKLGRLGINTREERQRDKRQREVACVKKIRTACAAEKLGWGGVRSFPVF
jgi:hypothetical protein